MEIGLSRCLINLYSSIQYVVQNVRFKPFSLIFNNFYIHSSFNNTRGKAKPLFPLSLRKAWVSAILCWYWWRSLPICRALRRILLAYMEARLIYSSVLLIFSKSNELLMFNWLLSVSIILLWLMKINPIPNLIMPKTHWRCQVGQLQEPCKEV
jgi:hypothetical protein